jgi:hypothetical protein
MKHAMNTLLKHIAAGIVCTLVSAAVSPAFEVDGLTNGMSIEKATTVLQGAAYRNIQTTENSMIASGGSRFILLNFCKDKLVLVQKHLPPGFDNFVRLIDAKRKELGKPSDSWSEPADTHLPIERNAVSFLWRDGAASVKVTFAELALNRQLDILYEIKNDCRQILD